jgi:hypothetical protein
MRPVSIFNLTAALGSIALVAACAGYSSTPNMVVPSLSTALRTREHGSPLGTCSNGRRRARLGQNPITKPAAGAHAPYLYVLDECGPRVDVLAKSSYREAGSITAGLSLPGDDVFLDSKGNLYVANAGNANVVEYAANNWSAPIFTYSANIGDPVAVTTDAHGNVYEADVGNGYINEYYQQQNGATVTSCQPTSDGAPYGVAVDSNNDVFASVLSYSSGGELVEYPGGLNYCQSLVVLPLPGVGRQGLALDKNANLLLANGTSVYVVDAPNYSTVSRTIGTGFSCASNVRLNKTNTLAFVTDSCNDTVTVVNYASGTNVAVLGSGNGLSQPAAAVEQPNAVY